MPLGANFAWARIPATDPSRARAFRCMPLNNVHWFGLAKVMRDPQLNFNKGNPGPPHTDTTAKSGVSMERDLAGPVDPPDLDFGLTVRIYWRIGGVAIDGC